MARPGIIVLSRDTDPEFGWMSDGWFSEEKRRSPRAKALMLRASQEIRAAHDVKDAIKRLQRAGFLVTRRAGANPRPKRYRKHNPNEHCYAVIDMGKVIKGTNFRFTVQCLPDRPLQVPTGVQILVRNMTRQGARALADHLNSEAKRGRNPRFLRGRGLRAFFQVRRSNPTLAVMGANPPAGEDIEATWAFLSYRRPDDPDGKRIVRDHEFPDGFVATPLDDGGILLKHPKGHNLWTRR